jgi:hypothetical protein
MMGEDYFEIDGAKFRAERLYLAQSACCRVIHVYTNGAESVEFDIPFGEVTDRDIRIAISLFAQGRRAGEDDGKRDLQIALKRLLKLEGF